MTEEMIAKRNTLRTISNAAIEAAKQMNINPQEYKVNDLIMLFAYNPDKKHTFNTFMGWKSQGYTIIKGSKAYILWGQPINKTRVNKSTGEIKQGSDDDSEAPFFPIAYLFRDDQISKPEPRQPRAEKAKPLPLAESEPINI
jgi:hypothetical protein